jgi:hypothetical protein
MVTDRPITAAGPALDPVRARGTFEVADHLAAQRLHYRLQGQQLRPVFKVLLGFLAVAYLAAAISDIFFAQSWRGAAALIGVPLGMWLLLGVYLPYTVRKTFRQQARFVVPSEYEISPAEFHVKNEFAELRVPLDSFVRWRANRQMILLYWTKGTFQIIPRRFLENEQDFQRLQDYLSAIPRSR